MLTPMQLSNRQLCVLMAGWITWHTPDTKRVIPFSAKNTDEITVLSDGDKILPGDDDFKALIVAGYIEQIDEITYMLTNDADELFAELTTLYRNRSAGTDVG